MSQSSNYWLFRGPSHDDRLMKGSLEAQPTGGSSSLCKLEKSIEGERQFVQSMPESNRVDRNTGSQLYTHKKYESLPLS